MRDIDRSTALASAQDGSPRRPAIAPCALVAALISSALAPLRLPPSLVPAALVLPGLVLPAHRLTLPVPETGRRARTP